ncbi:penicillin-binding protein 1C [Spirochaetia bacterium 38H-sp]|uniref:peptidoglycan glycosyltransferase n=1 Tax=Rarispira pelagica TaxID=3141764 RepID=A0ABU9U8K8_9SPIR
MKSGQKVRHSLQKYLKQINKLLDTQIAGENISPLPFLYLRTIITSLSLFLSVFFLIIYTLFYWPLPDKLFDDPYCTVIKDRNNRIIQTMIADDMQWRFPAPDKLPQKYIEALIRYEDKRFYLHGGIDSVAILRAIKLNTSKGAIISGGSTITMQLARLARKGQARTIIEKIIEAWMAIRIERKYSKEEILRLYASHAPFGGNIVGIEAAAWRYFARQLNDLSWAESAFLAVLPQDPALFFQPHGKEEIRKKRDFLLTRLWVEGKIDKDFLNLSYQEEIPDKLYDFPTLAPHLLVRAIEDGQRGKIIKSTIEASLQTEVKRIVDQYYTELMHNNVHNAAALVVDLATGEVLAYIGNTPEKDPDYGGKVDCISAKRSPGSTLKPFLYAMALTSGEILPTQLLPDIPISFGGFSPRNFHRTYYGIVGADKALTESLNIPFSILTARYGYRRFYSMLQRLGLRLPFPPDHYGLSIILGGVDISLWELSQLYAGLGRSARGEYDEPFFSHTYIMDKKPAVLGEATKNIIDKPSAVITLNTLKDLARPGIEASWDIFARRKKIAWKTGTSWGQRDAWAIGLTPHYLVAVWVGNATGEGNPVLLGAKKAAPLLFNIFRSLPFEDDWFTIEKEELYPVEICTESGMRAGSDCPTTKISWLPPAAAESELCKYHKLLHLDAEGKHQVDSSTYPVSLMQHKSWFILPPLQAYYYQKSGHPYQEPPPILGQQKNTVEIGYPSPGAVLYIPIDLDGKREQVVAEAACQTDSPLYWHLDGKYLGVTTREHSFLLSPPAGEHRLYIIDNKGNSASVEFTVKETIAEQKKAR